MVDPNSRTWQALGLAADVVVVNALTIVCSLPVVTAGAALSAAHGTLLEMVREEGAKPARTYFSYFTRTWRTATFGSTGRSAAWTVALRWWPRPECWPGPSW